jgi:NAD(P)-dependent dehydrogenase (short-subunit alcohol dehydrogenase family)
MKYALPELVKTKGVILNTASQAGIVGFAGMAAYSASKGGVVQLTRTAAAEYGPFGVRVNCICPGPIMTPLVERMAHLPVDERLREHQPPPLAPIGSTDDIASAALYLVSDQSRFVTGVALPIDGGAVAI